jgi:hypothetical protein
LRNLAWVEWNLGDYSAAQVHAKEAQRLAIISADLHREALALEIEATCCNTLGNYTKAMSLCIRARELLGLCGMSHGHADHSIMNAQAEIHRHKSEYMLRLAVSMIAFLKEPLYRIPTPMALLYSVSLKLMCWLVLQRMMCRGIVTEPENC